MMPSSIHENARQVVEDVLQLSRASATERSTAEIEEKKPGADRRKEPRLFIDDQWRNIETRLLRAQAKHADDSATVDFFAECLPYAAAIVHAGSTSENFIEAKVWAKREHPLEYADEVSILALLTFVYLVDKGVAKSQEAEYPEENRKKWKDIKFRLDGLLGERKPDAGGKPQSSTTSHAAATG